MKKEEFIAKYGKATYERMRERNRQWNEEHPDKVAESKRRWEEEHPEKVVEHNHNKCRKGGRDYEKTQRYNHTGLQGERNKIRWYHAKQWHDFKMIIAPDSQIHHQWRPRTAEYDGVALVEKDAHMHGIIDVVRILEGEINSFTEKELQGGLAI
jgi:hypothetical protein